MFNSPRNSALICFVVAWVLTLNGTNILIDWLGQLIVGLGVSPQASFLPVLGLSIQIVLNLLTAVLAYLSFKDKALKPMAIVAVSVNVLIVVNSLATFLFAVLSGQFTL